MTVSLFKIHTTIFEKKPAKEIIVIEDLNILANSEEYGSKDLKRKLRWMKYINAYCDFIDVWYKPNKNNHGRLEAELSMCDEWGEIRALLSDKLYFDIDGVNMGFTIFHGVYNLLTSNMPTAPKLVWIESYISSRDYWFNLVHDKYFKMFDKNDTEIKYRIKQLFTRLLNGGSVKKWKQDFSISNPELINNIGSLAKEIKEATKLLFEYLPEFKIKSKTSEKDTISHFIYETEKKCVEQLYIALGCPETYMYCKDGIMVLKSQFTETQITKIIEQARQSIDNLYGILIDFKIKPMVQEIDISELTPSLQCDLLADHTERLNKEYAKIKSINSFAYKSWDGEVKFMSKSELINEEMDCAPKVKILKWCNFHAEEKLMEVRIIDEWLLDCNKPKYLDIGLYPHDRECPKYIYNTWTPFLASTYDECPDDELIDELEFLLNHMLILCNHEKVIYDYFIRWFGQMLKYPSDKTTAPTFISEEGAGKGSLFELFRRVLGDSKVLETTKPDLVLGQFNELLINAFLVIFNELERKQILEHQGSIKGFITDKSVQINGKGKKPFKMLSIHRLLNATNNETGGAISPHNGDRRNVIIRCSDELCNNREYFNKFYELLDNKKLIRKFYDYCYNLDGLEKLELPPKTEHHDILIDGNKCYITEFMKEKTYNWTAQKITTMEILPLQLYTEFKEWADANGFKYETNTIHLVRKIGLLKIPNSKARAKGSRYITFNIDELIQFFKLKRNEEHDVILEDANAQEIAPIETIDRIILPRPNMEKEQIILKVDYTNIVDRDDFNSFLDNLMY